MYDKSEIEDSLEFCRQIKDFYAEPSNNNGSLSNATTDRMISETQSELTNNTTHSWDAVLKETDSSGAVGVSLGSKSSAAQQMPAVSQKKPVVSAKKDSPVEQQEKKGEHKKRGLFRGKEKQNETKPKEVYGLLEEENEEKRLQEEAKERARQMALQRARQAQVANQRNERLREQQAKAEAEARAKAEAEARAKAEAKARAKAEALRKQQIEQERIAKLQQAQKEAVARAREQIARQKQQEALQQAKKQQAQEELLRRQAKAEEAERERIRRENEARQQAAAMEQARARLVQQKNRQADQAELLRRRVEEQKRQQAQAARDDRQRQQAVNAEMLKRRQEQQLAARTTYAQSDSELARQRQLAAREAEEEAIRLHERAEELRRQAEIAELDARRKQLELESAQAKQRYVQTDVIYTDRKRASAQTAAAYARPEMPQPQRTPQKKLSEEEINVLFAQGLEKEMQESKSRRKEMIQRQSDKEKARIRQQREESGELPPEQKALELLKQARNKLTVAAASVVDYIRDKSEDPEVREQQSKLSRWFANILVVGICVIIAYVFASIVTNFVVHPTKVEGESMESTLTNGDTVLIQKMSYHFSDPQRYDVVVFPVPYYNSDTKYIKRVIGLPGETVQIIEGKIYINGNELKDDIYGKDDTIADPGDAADPITLADDEYFVLGDNRNMSTDSRSSYVGLIRRKNIIGKAQMRILPFSKIGKVK